MVSHDFLFPAHECRRWKQTAYSTLVRYTPFQSPSVISGKQCDGTRSWVRSYVYNGWPDQVEDALRPFKTRQDEIGVEGDCLMWGIQVIVPEALQTKVLYSLHDTHPGATRMKATARSYFWWSGLDKAIEDLVRSCSACQALRSAPAAAPFHPWVWPDAPWKRIHVDFAGPFRGKMYFIIVDAHSK